MSLHDTIQPGFTFLVGVALPYSLRSRQRKGESFRRMLFHTIWRSLILIALGIFLRSTDSPMTYFTFEDTLTQIGLGYTFGFLLTFARPRWQWISLAAILFGYWLAWALYPAPGANFDWAAVGVPADWHQHLFTGFAAHWNKNSNLGQAFDVWFLNLFPRPSRFALQRRRLPDAQLYSHAGHHAAGHRRRALVPRVCAEDSLAQVPVGGVWRCARPACCSTSPESAPSSSASGHPPGRCSAAACASSFWPRFLGHRRQKTSRHRVSASGGRHELDCRLRDGGVMPRISSRAASASILANGVLNCLGPGWSQPWSASSPCWPIGWYFIGCLRKRFLCGSEAIRLEGLDSDTSESKPETQDTLEW